MAEYRSTHAETSRIGRHRAARTRSRFWEFLRSLMAVGLNIDGQ